MVREADAGFRRRLTASLALPPEKAEKPSLFRGRHGNHLVRTNEPFVIFVLRLQSQAITCWNT